MVTLAEFICRCVPADVLTCQRGCLFPSLVNLIIVMEDGGWFPNYTHSLCAETLQTISLDTGYDLSTGGLAVHGKLSAIIPTLRVTWPNLRSVKIDEEICVVNEKEDSAFVNTLSGWLDSLMRLEELHLRLSMKASLIAIKAISEHAHVSTLFLDTHPNNLFRLTRSVSSYLLCLHY